MTFVKLKLHNDTRTFIRASAIIRVEPTIINKTEKVSQIYFESMFCLHVTETPDEIMALIAAAEDV